MGLVKVALHFSGCGTVQRPGRTGLPGPYDASRSVKMNYGVLTSSFRNVTSYFDNTRICSTT
jgi:hypothetical protein